MRISDWSSDVCSSYLASRLAELERIPLPLYTLEQIELSETYHIFRTELARRGPKPTIAPEQIEEMRHTWHQLTHGEEVTCPKCQHEFVPGRPEGLVEPEWSLAELKAQRSEERREGKESVSTCGTRGSLYPEKKKKNKEDNEREQNT